MIDCTLLEVDGGGFRLIYKDKAHDVEQRCWLVSRAADVPTGPVSAPFTDAII